MTVQGRLAQDHASSIMHYTNEENGRTWDLDMRCEVALITRNVVIQGDDASASQKFGCHTVALHGGHYRCVRAVCC